MIGAFSRVVPLILLSFKADQFKPFRFDQISLGEHDQPAFDAEQIKDGEMFPSLSRNAFICGDNQQDRIDAAIPESILPIKCRWLNVDDAYLFTIRQSHRGKPQVDGHLPGNLFFEAVGIDTCERGDQGAFTMVDMPGGSDNVHGVQAFLSINGAMLWIES